MANLKGAKTTSRVGSKGSNLKKEAPTEEAENEAKTQDPKRIESPEIVKDSGSENLNKDKTDTNIIEKNEQEVKNEGLEKETDDKTDTDLFEEEDINLPEAETEVDIEATGTGKFVEEALEGEREKERDTLKRLVEENVRLERQLTKTQEQLSVTLYDKDDLQLQIELQKQDNDQLRQHLGDKDKEIQDLEDKLKIAEAEIIGAKVHEQLESSPIMYDKVAMEKRLQDTQLKLKRMVSDGEEKDRHMEYLQTELHNLQALCDVLKAHVADKEKLDTVMEEYEKKKANEEGCNEIVESSALCGEEVIRKQEPESQHTESKTCSIQ